MARVDVALEHRERAPTTLGIEGRLRPGWCGSLATGLASRGVDIVRGHAVSVSAGVWRARFELCCPDPAELRRDVLLEMLESGGAVGFTSPIELLGYRLEDVSGPGTALRLDVRARDRVGLLAALLRRLAYYSLFPSELRLETFARVACDRLWLRAAGGATPPPQIRRTLVASLDALVKTSTARPPSRARPPPGARSPWRRDG